MSAETAANDVRESPFSPSVRQLHPLEPEGCSWLIGSPPLEPPLLAVPELLPVLLVLLALPEPLVPLEPLVLPELLAPLEVPELVPPELLELAEPLEPPVLPDPPSPPLLLLPPFPASQGATQCMVVMSQPHSAGHVVPQGPLLTLM